MDGASGSKIPMSTLATGFREQLMRGFVCVGVWFPLGFSMWRVAGNKSSLVGEQLSRIKEKDAI
jgi:hypothetical protein